MASGERRYTDCLNWPVCPNYGFLRVGSSTSSVVKIPSTLVPFKFYCSRATAGDMIQIHLTSTAASGTMDVVQISYTQSTAQTSGYIKGIRCTMTSNVKTPGSFNAVKGIIDYQTNGYAHGDAAPLAAELTMPNSQATRGTFSAIEAQIAIGASTNWDSAGPLSFLRLKVNGTVLKFEEEGFLLSLQGIGAATAGEIFDTCTAAAASHALKILIGSTNYYILLQDNVGA